MAADDRPALLIAALRRQAEHQRRLESMSARVFADRDLSTFAQLDRERGELAPRADALRTVISTLVESDIEWREHDLLSLVEALASFDSWSFTSVDEIPLEPLAGLVARALGRLEPSQAVADAVAALAQRRLDQGGPAPARRAAKLLADAVANGRSPAGARSPAFLIDGDDDWGAAALLALKSTGEQSERWYPLLEHAATATASKPSKRWLAQARELRDALGDEELRALAQTLLGALSAPASGDMRRGTGIGALAGLDHLPRAVPTAANAALLRGLVWTCAQPADKELAAYVATAARECSKKLPDVGARAPKVVNACLWALGEMGEVGAPHLTALSQKARKPAARSRVEAALDRAAASARTPRAVLEDLAVPSHGLEHGPLELSAGAVRCELKVEPPGRAVIAWRNGFGEPLARPPRNARTPKVVSELRATLAAQRLRFERLLASGAPWPWARFRDGVLGHPVVSSIASSLIVELDGNGAFLPAVGDPALPPAADATVRLWHPAGKTVDEVLQWREVIERERVVQPFKQAHREVYLLTPEERRAGYASRRFAGHLVRQHALRALCEARGWTCRLQGPFDSGPSPEPTLRIPQAGLVARLDVEPIDDDRLQSGHAIFLYVRTGAVRFFREAAAREPVELAAVPALVLSEVLRDVDLFVSVAGVAADPQWPLDAPDPWPERWREHAYGELSPLGQRRRELLERIVAALPIADRLTFDDRFLLVQGERHRYRIHLGTGNVMREPGSRHLCIVAAGGGRLPGESGHVWLPFEGDVTLAEILSKALMLAHDDAITTPSIRAQIDAP